MTEPTTTARKKLEEVYDEPPRTPAAAAALEREARELVEKLFPRPKK